MKVSEFKNVLVQLRDTDSQNEKKDIIREVSDSSAAISFLSGSEFDDSGLDKKMVKECAKECYRFEEQSTLSETLSVFDKGRGTNCLEGFRADMEYLSEASDNEMKRYLVTTFEQEDYPSVFTHACLNDWPTGVSDKTIADALGVREP